jgi:hypothetical protein
MVSPTETWFRQLIDDNRMELSALDQQLAGLTDTEENRSKRNALNSLKQMFHENIEKLEQSIEAIR